MQSTPSRPIAKGDRLGGPIPSARPALALQVSISLRSSSFPWLHPLKIWSLRETRRGSLRALPGADQGQGRERRRLCEEERDRRPQLRLLGGAGSAPCPVDARGC